MKKVGKPRKPHGSIASLDEAGEAVVFERIAAAETVGKVAESFGVSRASFYGWVKQGGDERRAAFEDARRQSADVHAENALEILDDASSQSTAEVTLAKAKSDVRKWLATCFNRTQYGDPGVSVKVNNAVNIGQLHLDALRASSHMRGIPRQEGKLISPSKDGAPAPNDELKPAGRDLHGALNTANSYGPPSNCSSFP